MQQQQPLQQQQQPQAQPQLAEEDPSSPSSKRKYAAFAGMPNPSCPPPPGGPPHLVGVSSSPPSPLRTQPITGDTSHEGLPPQQPLAGKEKKQRRKKEKGDGEKETKEKKSSAPKRERKKKKGQEEEDDTRPKVLFRGSRFELWLETRFEEELLKLLDVPALHLSANLVNGTSPSPSSSSTVPVRSWVMTRLDEERLFKEKWRKRYHVYAASVLDDLPVASHFQFHIRTRNSSTGEFSKLPFIMPSSSQVTAYSSYLSLLGGAQINPSNDHSGYPPGEGAGEDACTLYEGADVSFVLVGQLVSPPPPSVLPPPSPVSAAAPIAAVGPPSVATAAGSSGTGGGGVPSVPPQHQLQQYSQQQHPHSYSRQQLHAAYQLQQGQYSLPYSYNAAPPSQPTHAAAAAPPPLPPHIAGAYHHHQQHQQHLVDPSYYQHQQQPAPTMQTHLLLPHQHQHQLPPQQPQAPPQPRP